MSNPTPTAPVLTTETIDKLFLELSQFTTAKTAKEIALEGSLTQAHRERDAAHAARESTQRELSDAHTQTQALMRTHRADADVAAMLLRRAANLFGEMCTQGIVPHPLADKAQNLVLDMVTWTKAHPSGGARDDITVRYDAPFGIANTPEGKKAVPPKSQAVDMSKLPVGVSVKVVGARGYGDATFRLMGYTERSIGYPALCWNEEHQTVFASIDTLRITEQTEYTYWSGTGPCPLPRGLRVAVKLRNGRQVVLATAAPPTQDARWEHAAAQHHEHHIIAYRVLGVSDGWTDGSERVK